MKALLATKIGMTSTIAQDGALSAVTLLHIDPCVITQVKTNETDGYSAVQIGSGTTKPGKALAGHLKAAKAQSKHLREIRINETDLQDAEDLSVGTTLTPEVFSIGDKVTVTGTTKGKGFGGTIKRHNFHRGRKTHGGRSYRRPGSIGSMYPQHIFKGKKMAGQTGHVRVSTKNLTVALVDLEHSVIGVTGAVPGPRKGMVLLRGAK